MEKGTPHCRLSLVKALVVAGKVRATASALSGAAGLGLGYADMLEVVNGLTAKAFYKSMTTTLTTRSGKTSIVR